MPLCSLRVGTAIHDTPTSPLKLGTTNAQTIVVPLIKHATISSILINNDFIEASDSNHHTDFAYDHYSSYGDDDEQHDNETDGNEIDKRMISQVELTATIFFPTAS